MPNNNPDITNGFDPETYRTMFQKEKDAIILEHIDHSIIDVNQAAEKMLGYTLDELRGSKAIDLVQSDDKKAVLHKIYVEPRAEDTLTFLTIVNAKGGNTIPVEMTITPFSTDSEWYFMLVLRDAASIENAAPQEQPTQERKLKEKISELITENKSIQQSEEKFRKLAEGSLQGIAILDGPPFKFTYANEASSRIAGYSCEELMNFTSEDIEELVHWTDRARILHLIGDILAGRKESSRTVTRFTHESNDVIWIDLSLAGIRIQDDISLVATFIDITEQRQAFADLLDSQKDLEIFASLLRHDLRNDLQVITGNSEVMRLAASDNDIVQEFAEANVVGVKRMLELLKIFGRPEQESKRMIAPTLESLSVEAAKAHVGMICQLHIDPDVLLTRVVGGRMLPMVFRNLINNSAKHAGESPRVVIRVKNTNEFVEVRVSDNGPGIPEEVRHDLFQKGVSTSGGGLGLYLSKKVVEAYGGSIELIEPENENEGAVFLVKLAIVS
jgi:PAS domain S-box-containing protein